MSLKFLALKLLKNSKFVVIAALICALFFLNNRLENEKEARLALEAQLKEESEKAIGWQTAAAEIEKKADIMRESAQACIDREFKSEMNYLERLEILRNLKIEEEKPQSGVIDAETRKKTVNRLNRPL